MNYGYVRVSTAQQHIDRQIEVLLNLGLNKRNIYIDYESGKDFNRNNYKKMINKLEKGDVVIIKSIDRLGRNYTMIIDEWRNITKEIGANIVVIDMPILNTNNEKNNLIGTFVSDIVLQILSFVAQNEREIMRLRQAEGIRTAKARGVRFGRPRINLPKNYDLIAKKYLNKEITNKDACSELGLSRSTFLRYLKNLEIKNTL